MAKHGRGLSSLLGGASAERTAANAGVQEIPLAEIVPNPLQPRRHFDEEALNALAGNLKANGLLQPVLVRPAASGYELIAGERRWRAAAMAGLPAIPALIRQADDAAALELALVENLLRDDLNPMELAAAYRELIAVSGLTQESVADHLGRSRPAVANTIRLLDLPPGIQQLIRDKALTAGHGRALLAVAEPKRRLALARKAVAEGLTVRALEQLIYKRPGARPVHSKTVALKAPHLKNIEQALSERFGTKVIVTEKKRAKRGTITIEFYSNSDFERILAVVGLGPELD